MEVFWEWFLPPLLGAIIGFFTNWLAIKMLFRPLRPKYFFGRRLPFTPGVIPGRRDELAEKIGETVATYLINDQELHRVLMEPRVHQELSLRLQEAWQRWSSEERSLQQLMEQRDDLPTERILAHGSNLLSRLLIQRLQDPLIEEKLRGILRWLIETASAHELTEGMTNRASQTLTEALIRLGDSPEQREHIEAKVDQWLAELLHSMSESDLTLRQLLGQDAEYALSQLVSSLEPKLADLAEHFIQQESLASQLTDKLQEWLGRQMLLGMLSSFITRERMEGLVARLLKETGAYLAQPQNRAVLSSQALQWLGARLEDPLSLWVERIGEERLASVLQHLKRRLLSELANPSSRAWMEQQLQQAFASLEGRSLHSIASSWGFDAELEEAPDRLWRWIGTYLYDERAEQQLAGQIQLILTISLRQPVKDSLGSLEIPQDAFALIATLLLSAAAGQASTLLQTLDISLMVRRKLMEFPIEEMERLVLEIAGRELSTITNLGGLLGALIGLSQLLIKLF